MKHLFNDIYFNNYQLDTQTTAYKKIFYICIILSSRRRKEMKFISITKKINNGDITLLVYYGVSTFVVRTNAVPTRIL